ncbi:hypothetical protein D3C71_2226560 [compost metagenome]
MALEYLQQQALEAAGQLVAELDEEGGRPGPVLIGLGEVTVLLAEALQHALPFE